METYLIYAYLAPVVFSIALGGAFICRHFFKKIIAVNIMGASVFLLFVSIAQRDAQAYPDPVPHAMVITGIVVAVSASALALAIARKVRVLTGRSSFKSPFDS